MKSYAEYILGLDVAAVISSLLIFLYGDLEVKSIFVLATELIFILSVVSLSFTFMYYIQIGENNWLLLPSLIFFGIGAALTFFSWFIGGLIALIALLFLIISKKIDQKERVSIGITYFGFVILAIMPPLGALFGFTFGMLDYMLISIGIILIFIGTFLALKLRKTVNVLSVGFILLTLSFLFITPAHELLSIHSNGAYGIYDRSTVALATITFFIFFGNLLFSTWQERKIMRDIDIGYKFLKNGKYQDALPHFQKAYKSFPDDERVLNGLGLTLMKIGNYTESEVHLRKLNRTSNGNNTYMTNLGNLYFRTGRIDKAIETYQDVLKRDPKFYNALNNIARCYMEKGNYAKAKEYLEKAINIDQDKKAAKLNYYFLLTAIGMKDEADKYKTELGGMVE